MTPILIPVLILSGIALAMAALLAAGRKAFYVEVDERQEKLMDILPGANCGGCGFAGCAGYAAALAKGEAAPNLCPPGGPELAAQIGRLLGIEVGEVVKKVALVACAGDSSLAPSRAEYLGVEDCAAAHAVAGGPKKCAYGCLGLGSCVRACPFGALKISDKGLAYVLEDKCTGCGQCVAVCPRNIIRMVPADEKAHVLCINPEKAKAVKEVCSAGCTGCKLCAKRSSRFVVEGALAHVDYAAKEDIPEEIRFVCTQGSILDKRAVSLADWVSNPNARETYESDRAKWKEAEKAKKAAAKAKAQKKAASDSAQGGDL
jgi:Na+-translocating ferredoxin:NAD+ oxidoreductase subunit B